MCKYCVPKDVTATPFASNAVNCTDTCTYPFMMDSKAMYSNLPLSYCEVCKHHINSQGNIPEPTTGVSATP